ncbi:MAG: hypothetical protein WCU88_05495 [Elusimicrobiota bacterium]|jgi:hypothetical protein
MDILIKLRLYLWIMVLGLWGLMIYQFLEDESAGLPQMSWVAGRLDARNSGPMQNLVHTPIPANQIFPPKPEELLLEPAMNPSSESSSKKEARRTLPPALLASLPKRTSAPARPASAVEAQEEEPAPVKALAYRRPTQETPTPKGFFKTMTPHFVLYAEGTELPSSYADALENIHANLMLDLAAFSPWARDERVSIYLFRSQDSYRRVTGRPSWSGGASSVKGRKIYLYESDESIGILAHELCHIYFDGFFLGGRQNPLWLSEGMATLVQTERGLAAPNWLKEHLDVLRRGGGYPLSELITVENTAGAEDSSVRLWYAQSYSVVRFLIRAQYRSSFYRFCTQLKDGTPMPEALYRAYGMPYNRVKALEYAWRYDLSHK